MRRTASEILSDLEIRIAHLERKQMSFDEGFLPSRDIILSDRELDERKKSHLRNFKKSLTKFLVELDDIAEGEYAIEDLGLGDGFLSKVERNSELYYSKAIQDLLKSTGLPTEEATLEGFLARDPHITIRLTHPEASISGLIAHAFKEIFRRVHFFEEDNKKAVFGIASDLLGFEVKP